MLVIWPWSCSPSQAGQATLAGVPPLFQRRSASSAVWPSCVPCSSFTAGMQGFRPMNSGLAGSFRAAWTWSSAGFPPAGSRRSARVKLASARYSRYRRCGELYVAAAPALPSGLPRVVQPRSLWPSWAVWKSVR